ncbi:cupin domain-containing protein [Sorangium sp. So ce1099]|uniref:cupin domain-containing protein n=1 Tax=Sorangium sp. So ce1099 TaxID=3133331 RepID=UPI003F630E86
MNEGAVHDVLGRVLELTHLRGRIYCHTSARAPWGLCVDASADAGFHLVTAGTCWLFLGEQRVALGPGDVVLLPRGSAHALADHARSRRIPLAAWLGARGTVEHRMRLGDGQGAETEVLCGVYAFEFPAPATRRCACCPSWSTSDRKGPRDARDVRAIACVRDRRPRRSRPCPRR